MNILYEDKDIIVVHKPAGVASQSDRSFLPDMVSQIRNHLAQHSTGSIKAIPYVGVVHRLDKPVEGILVFAKNKKAAAILSTEIQNGGSITKIYRATVVGELPLSKEPVTLTDHLFFDKRQNISKVVPSGTAGAKKASLEYQVTGHDTLDDGTKVSRLSIHLLTGRHHQIRVQLAHAGYPIVGDRKYGKVVGNLPLQLCACKLSFVHPVTKKRMEFAI